MTTAPKTSRRPTVVTIAVVLIYISGLSNAAVGLLVLLSRYQVPAEDVLTVSLVGAAVILVGLLTLAVASAIARGSRLARILLTVYLVLQIALHVVTIVTTEWDWAAIVLTVAEAFILFAMWAPPGARHFRR